MTCTDRRRAHECILEAGKGCRMAGAGAPWTCNTGEPRRCTHACGKRWRRKRVGHEGYLDHGDTAYPAGGCGGGKGR